MSEKKIESISLETAKDFVEYTRLASPRWQGPEGKWGFRGQADSTWPLIAKAFRAEFEKRRYQQYPDPPDFNDPESRQAFLELQVFLEFFKLADATGHSVPGAEYILSPEFEERIERFNAKEWPFRELVSGLAISQHHGVPTRLLDFTSSPTIAAFFAASSRIEDTNQEFSGDEICVWAVNLLFVRYAWTHPPYRNRWIQIVQVPTAENVFLNRQQGFFLYPVRENLPEDCTQTNQMSIDSLIERHARNPKYKDFLEQSEIDLQEVESPLIYKITVPASEVRSVLKILDKEDRIYRAALMPTYDNVTKTLEFKRDNDLFGLS